MTDYIWTGALGNGIWDDQDNWVVASTDLPNGSYPGATPGSDTAIFCAHPLAQFGTALTHSSGAGTMVRTENMYFYGTGSTSLEGLSGGFTYPGLDSSLMPGGWAIDVTLSTTGNLWIGCGTTSTALMDEGPGFDAICLQLIQDSWATDISAAGPFYMGAGARLIHGNLRISPGIVGGISRDDSFWPTDLRTVFNPQVAGDYNLMIHAPDGGNALFSEFGINMASGHSNLFLDCSVKAVMGAARPNEWVEPVHIMSLVYSPISSGGTVSLKWKASTATPSAPIGPGDVDTRYFQLIGHPSDCPLPHTTSSAGLINENYWRWKLDSMLYSGIPTYCTISESSVGEESGALWLSSTIIDDLREINGYGIFRVDSNSVLANLDSITIQTGYTSIDNTTSYNLAGPHRISGGMVNSQGYVFFDMVGPFSLSGLVLCQSTHSSPVLPVARIASSGSSDNYGPYNLSIEGITVEPETPLNCMELNIDAGSTLQPHALLGAGEACASIHGWSPSVDQLTNAGNWSAAKIQYYPLDGREFATTNYINYTTNAGVYEFKGGPAGYVYTFNINAPPGVSPNFVAAGITLHSGEMQINFPTALSEIKIGDFELQSGMNSVTGGGIDFTNLATMWIDSTISGAPIPGGVRTVDGQLWTGWPTDGIPFVRATAGMCTVNGVDQALEVVTAINPMIRYLYCENATVLNYVQGRIRQLSLVGTSTLSATSPPTLQPTTGMTCYGDVAAATITPAQIFQVDMRDVGDNNAATFNSQNTTVKGTIRVGYHNVQMAKLNIVSTSASTVDIYNLPTSVVLNYLVFTGAESTLVNQPSVSNPNGNGAGYYHLQIEGDLKVKSVFAEQTSISSIDSIGGTLSVRNSSDTDYLDFTAHPTTIKFINAASTAIKCKRFVTDSTLTLGDGLISGDNFSKIEVYHKHPNPLVEADYAVWFTGKVGGQSADTSKSQHVVFSVKANDATEYAAIHQSGVILEPTYTYHGLGVSALSDATKLIFDSTVESPIYSGAIHFSDTETTFDNTFTFEVPNHTPNPYYFTGTLGASCTNPRIISTSLGRGSATPQGGVTNFTGEMSFFANWASCTTSFTLTHLSVGNATFTTFEGIDGDAFRIDLPSTANMTWDMNSAAYTISAGNLIFNGSSSIITATSTLSTFNMRGAGTLEVQGSWVSTGVGCNVNIGDGVSTTTTTYKWANGSPLPGDTYPTVVNIAGLSSLKPALAVTGSAIIAGDGSFDWNSGFVGQQTYEITSNTAGTPLANTIAQLGKFWNLGAGHRTVWRFTPKADTVGDLILPTALHGDLEIGLRGGVSGSYTAAAAYRVPNANMTLYGQLIGDYANTLYAYGSLDLNGEGGLAAQLTIIGQANGDTSTLYGKSSLGSNLTIHTQDMSLLNYGTVNISQFSMDNHLNTIYDNLTLRWLGTTNQCGTVYIEGKGSGVTTVSVQGSSTTWRITNHLYIGHGTSPAVGLTLSDYTAGLCMNPTNLTLGSASIVDFSTANSYWLFDTSTPIITDANITGTTVGSDTVYGTPNLGLVVVDGVTLTVNCGGANRGIQADLLYLKNATFKTTGDNERTLYLRANAGVAANYPEAVTDTDSAGISAPALTRPALHAYGTSVFEWPSTDTHHCDYGTDGTKDLLVLGSPSISSSYDAASIFTKQASIRIGDTLGVARPGRHTEVVNRGAGFYIYSNNGDGIVVNHVFNQTNYRGEGAYSWALFYTNYNGSSLLNRDTITINQCNFTQDVVASFSQFGGAGDWLLYVDLTMTNNLWNGLYGSTMVDLSSNVYDTLTVTANTFTNTHTTGTIFTGPNCADWYPINNASGITIARNYIYGPNMTSGTGFLSPVSIDHYNFVSTAGGAVDRNAINVGSGANPLDVDSGGNIHVVGWSLPTTNTNFGNSVQSSTTNYVVSEFTNGLNQSTTLISGQLSNFKSTVAHAPDLWTNDQSGPNSALTIVHGDSTYRYGAGNTTQIRGVGWEAVPINPVKVEWTNWDDDDAITVNIRKLTGTGINNYHNRLCTNGGIIDLNQGDEINPDECLGWLPIVGFPTDTAAYKNLKITDSVTGTVLFSDYQLLKLNTQEEAPSTQGLLEFGPGVSTTTAGWSGNRGHTALTQGALSHLYSSAKVQEISMELNLAEMDTTVDTGLARWAISCGGQDTDNQYVFRLQMDMVGATQRWDYSIVKIENGTETALATGTQGAHSGAPQDPIALMKLTWDTSSGNLTGSVTGVTMTPSYSELNAIDTTFTAGYFGVGADSALGEPIVKNVHVREGDGLNDIILRNTSVIFMPNSKFIPSTSINNVVDLRDVTFNGNLQAVFPGLNDGKFTPYLENVVWADNRIDEVINTFIQLVGARIEVDGDIQLVDEGKLWLTGCYITGRNNIRWRIRTEQVSDPTTPPLKIQGSLLSGLLTTIRVPNASYETFVLDDPAQNTAVIRVQHDKDIDVVRQRVVGLDYNRMVFNGFESSQTTITCQCVQNAYLMGMMEKLWRENTLIELISPYCYTYRAKITQYNQRILNPQISASQFVIEIEEWRED